MLLNGWNITEEASVWTGQTEPDPQGNSHVLMGIMSRETPQGEEQEGLFLKLLLDGKAESMLQYPNVSHEDYARENPAQECIEDAMQTVLESRQARRAWMAQQRAE